MRHVGSSWPVESSQWSELLSSVASKLSGGRKMVERQAVITSIVLRSDLGPLAPPPQLIQDEKAVYYTVRCALVDAQDGK